MRKLFAAALCALAALPAPSFAAETFPSRPVRSIVPYAAGGPNDVLARMVGGKLGDAWGKQAVIDNRPDAGGNLAMELAVPDGYTIVLYTNAEREKWSRVGKAANIRVG